MANRILKESICFSPEIEQLDWFEEVVFYHLLATADDFGHMDGRDIVLARILFPARDDVSKEEMAGAINKLVEVGLVERYSVEGRPYIAIVTWHKHQKLRRYKQKYPFPEGYKLPVPANIVTLLDGETPSSDGELQQDDGGLRRNVAKRRRITADCSKTPSSDGGMLQDDGGMSQSDGALRSDDRALSQPDGALLQDDRLNTKPKPNTNSTTTGSDNTGDTGGGGGGGENEDNPFGYWTGKRPDFNTIEAYASSTLQSLSPDAVEEIGFFKTQVSEELIRHAINEACDNGAPRWKYAKTVLQRYIDAGIKTVGDAKAADEQFRRNKKHPGSEPETVRQDDWVR